MPASRSSRVKPAAIARMQRSAAHYFQRPDKDYSLSTRRARPSTATRPARVRADRRPALAVGRLRPMSSRPASNPNDIGRVTQRGRHQVQRATLRYRETTPGKMFRNYSIGFSQNNEWNYGGNRQGGNAARQTSTLTFLNFWTATLASGPDLPSLDRRLTRGGPLMADPERLDDHRLAQKSDRGANRLERHFTADDRRGGRRTLNVNGGLSFRPGHALAALGDADLRSPDRLAAICDDARRRASRDLRPALRLRVHRPQHVVDPVPHGLHAEARSQPRSLRGTVRGQRPLLRLRRAVCAARAAAPRLRHGRDDRVAAAGRQPDRDRRRADVHAEQLRLQRPLVPQQRRASLGVAAGQHPLSGVAAGSPRVEKRSARRVGLGDMFSSLSAPGSNFFVVKMSFWLPVW